MSEAIKSLAKAQTEMGKALKNTSNPHFKSKYADLGSVMDACFTALHANGFAVMQPCGRDEFGQYVDTVLAHASGDTFTSRVHLVIGKADMQGVGSAITYARRYGLLGMAGLAPEDDDGEAQKAPPRPRNEAPKPEPTPFDAPPFDAEGCLQRLLTAIARRKTKQQLTALWGEESAARIALKGADQARYDKFYAAFKAAGDKAMDDPALQAPNPEKDAAA